MKKIKVKALGEAGKVVGYLNHRRVRGGDVFFVSEDMFSKSWMEKVGKKAEQPEVLDLSGEDEEKELLDSEETQSDQAVI